MKRNSRIYLAQFFLALVSYAYEKRTHYFK